MLNGISMKNTKKEMLDLIEKLKVSINKDLTTLSEELEAEAENYEN